MALRRRLSPGVLLSRLVISYFTSGRAAHVKKGLGALQVHCSLADHPAHFSRGLDGYDALILEAGQPHRAVWRHRHERRVLKHPRLEEGGGWRALLPIGAARAPNLAVSSIHDIHHASCTVDAETSRPSHTLRYGGDAVLLVPSVNSEKGARPAVRGEQSSVHGVETQSPDWAGARETGEEPWLFPRPIEISRVDLCFRW